MIHILLIIGIVIAAITGILANCLAISGAMDEEYQADKKGGLVLLYIPGVLLPWVVAICLIIKASFFGRDNWPYPILSKGESER